MSFLEKCKQHSIILATYNELYYASYITIPARYCSHEELGREHSAIIINYQKMT